MDALSAHICALGRRCARNAGMAAKTIRLDLNAEQTQDALAKGWRYLAL